MIMALSWGDLGFPGSVEQLDPRLCLKSCLGDDGIDFWTGLSPSGLQTDQLSLSGSSSSIPDCPALCEDFFFFFFFHCCGLIWFHDGEKHVNSLYSVKKVIIIDCILILLYNTNCSCFCRLNLWIILSFGLRPNYTTFLFGMIQCLLMYVFAYVCVYKYNFIYIYVCVYVYL